MYLSFMYSESQIMQLTYPATIFQHVKGYAKLPTTARTLVWGKLSKKKKKWFWATRENSFQPVLLN